MKLQGTPIPDVVTVQFDIVPDARGAFARVFDAGEFRANGLEPSVMQSCTSFNRHRRTLRGMHYQRDPFSECKLIQCTRGAIYDVAVDLRPSSASYLSWWG